MQESGCYRWETISNGHSPRGERDNSSPPELKHILNSPLTDSQYTKSAPRPSHSPMSLYPPSETNPSHEKRQVVLKTRKLSGRFGTLVRGMTKVMVEDEPVMLRDFATVMTSHWGIQVGDNLWELKSDAKRGKVLAYQRLTGGEIWNSDGPGTALGWTRCSASEIDRAGTYADSLGW